MTLTLYFREYCSLCHDMLARLRPWQQQHGFAIDVVDVDADPVLEERFNELNYADFEMIIRDDGCGIDEARLAAHLAAQPAAQGGEIG